jgi:hypothetical protein
MKIAMLSYNSILSTKGNGWVDDALFMIQSDSGKAYGAPQIGIGTLPELQQMRNEGVSQVQGAVMRHWDHLADLLPELDKVVIYVGDNGSEHTIRYAAERKLDAKKAIFVLCDCNEQNKRRLIEENGFGKSPIIMCECGGRRTMARLANTFLETGQLLT